MNRLPSRRAVLGLAGAALLPFEALAAAGRPSAEDVLLNWYRLTLELVRHTPTCSPPVVSRALAYIGVAAYECVASGDPSLTSLAGQLNGLRPTPRRQGGETHDEAIVLHGAMTALVGHLFSNTGPTGQRVMERFAGRWRGRLAEGVPEAVAQRSIAHGEAQAAHVRDWASGDGGAAIVNMGFPFEYTLTEGPAHWVPTSAIRQQQTPLLPGWGKNRSFAMANASACGLPPPPDYSEAADSAFHREALEVYETRRALTAEQIAIARFWSDDPMLSSTPPGHWVTIALDIIERDAVGLAAAADALARLGVTLADAFIACWASKFDFDLLRPVTYIKRHIDPTWEPLLITPPFPEYPSGHSTQSGAAATVLTAMFGTDFAFTDATPERDGLAPRRFSSFHAAAAEAGISRLYGGIHFRAAIERGLDQGRCVGGHAVALRTRA